MSKQILVIGNQLMHEQTKWHNGLQLAAAYVWLSGSITTHGECQHRQPAADNHFLVPTPADRSSSMVCSGGAAELGCH